MRLRHFSERNASYADKEVTVLGLPEEIPPNLVVRATNQSQQQNVNVATERSRQIQPSSHVAPSYLPSGESTEIPLDEDKEETEDLSDEDEDDAVPALPSVKTLTNKFQAFSCRTSPSKPSVKVSQTGGTDYDSTTDSKVSQLQENKAAVRARVPVLVKQRYNNNKSNNNNNNTAYKQVRVRYSERLTGVPLGLITLSPPNPVLYPI